MNLARWLLRHSFVRFAMVGTLGAPVDAGILWLMVHEAGLDPYSGRMISWLCAATFTWTGNRYFTFPERRARGFLGALREWLRFLAANGVGGLVNVGLYATLVRFAPPPLNNLYLALVAGVLAGLAFNFALSRIMVFKTPVTPG
jgi:putative flippase GtrA